MPHGTKLWTAASACNRAGFLVPEDVAVIGVDDEDVLCQLCTPPLSSVSPNAERIGYQAAELLDAFMAGNAPTGQRIALPPQRVVARQSSDVLSVGDPLVAAAIRFLREQTFHGCSVRDVVKKFGISRGALENRFRKSLNRSPKEEIRRIQDGAAFKYLADAPHNDLPLLDADLDARGHIGAFLGAAGKAYSGSGRLLCGAFLPVEAGRGRLEDRAQAGILQVREAEFERIGAGSSGQLVDEALAGEVIGGGGQHAVRALAQGRLRSHKLAARLAGAVR